MRSVFKFPGGEFHPNFKLNEDLRRQHVIDPQLERWAQEAALGAREIAVRVAFDQGDYFASIHAGLATNRRGLAVGRISAPDFKALWIERGWQTSTGRQVKGRNVLRRGLRKTGLRVRSSRRAPST